MRLGATLLLGGALVAACSTPLPTTPATAPPVAPATAISGSTEGPTSTDFSDSELCPGGTGNGCRLVAGEHHSLGFGDGIAFTLEGSWIARANETDVISLEFGLENNPSVVELITGAPRFEDPVTHQFTAVTDAATAIATFRKAQSDASPSFTVAQRPSTTLGGAPALVFDITSDAYGHELFSYPVTEHGSFLLTARTARFIWGTWAGAPFIVSIESDSRSFDDFVRQVQPLLDSLELGDGD